VAEVSLDEGEIVVGAVRTDKCGNMCCTSPASIGQGALNLGNQMHPLFPRPALVRDFEALISTSTTWVLVASVKLITKRLTPGDQTRSASRSTLTPIVWPVKGTGNEQAARNTIISPQSFKCIIRIMENQAVPASFDCGPLSPLAVGRLLTWSPHMAS